MTLPIDSATTLANINDDRSLLNDLLSILISEIPSWINQFKEPLNHVALAQQLHKIKGVCCYITLPKLNDLIHTTETLLKNTPNSHEQLKAHQQLIIDELTYIKDYYHEHIQY
ncbi:MAG: Hpt domain-containing protein [Candidatus Comchoanobacterales bacterium]